MLRMKIKSDIQYKQLPSFVKEQLRFVYPEGVKWGSATFVLFLYDIPLGLSFIALMKMEFVWLILPFALILHIWCLRLLIKNPYSTQFEMIRFMGVYGVIGAITLFIMLQAISYFTMNIHSIMYYVLLNLAIIVGSYIIIKYQIVKYKDIHLKLEQKEKKKITSKDSAVIAITPVLGLMVGRFVGKTEVLKYYYVLAVDIFLIMLFIYFAAKFIHRYFFMKANMRFVSYEEPTKKEKKKLIEKGVEFK